MKIPVLDHGYIEKIEHWGSEERIIESARQSTDKGFLGWGTPDDPGDEKLLRRLWTHKHYSPFEFAGLVIEVQAPIMVFREWHRHRTQSYNEMSGRYTALPDLQYVPGIERIMFGAQSKLNKQGSMQGIDEVSALEFQQDVKEIHEFTRIKYEKWLNRGIARELARIVLPVAQYSRMRASGNLRNWLAFLTLRMDPAAQWEIRQFANVVGAIIGETFPRTWSFFQEVS